MHNKRKIQSGARRLRSHGKRQLGSVLSGIIAGPPTVSSPIIPPSPSEQPSTRNSIPIPPIPTIPDTTLTVIPSTPPTRGTSIVVPSNPLTILSLPSSRPSSNPPTLSNPQTLSPSSTAPPPAASSQSPSTSSSAPSNSEVTSVITTMSDAHTVVVTTVIRPAASLSPDDKHSKSFLDNKAESGAVFAIVGLVVVAGVGFLGYRFYKTVQRRKADRDTEEAARAAARVRVRLDDGDEDDAYGGGSTAFSRNMTQLHNEPHSIRSGADYHSADGLGEFDGTPTADHTPYLPFPVPLHHSPGSLQIQTALDSFGVPMDIYDPTESAYSAHTRNRSGESGEDLLSTRSNTNGGSSSTDYVTSPVRSNTNASRTSSTAHRPLSVSFTSSHTPSEGVTRSRSSHHLERPPLPVLPLPAAFGEGERPSTGQSVLGDDEDYHGSTGRVLKIANE